MAYLFKKIIKEKTYWYIGESKRKGKKVQRIWQKYLGPAEKVADQLLNGIEPKEIDMLDLGLCGALLSLNQKINFVDIVNKVIPKRDQGLTYGEHLLLTIINRIDNPQSHNKLGDWFSGTILKRRFTIKKSYLSSQTFWNHWNKVTDKQIEEIQELLLENLITHCDISQLCFDPTNFTTYIQEHKNQEIMKFGHSKNGRKGFRQVNLSLLVTQKEGIPLWHHTYGGNINDVTEFKTCIKTLIKRVSFFSKKCKKITLILDKGNNSKNNMKNVANKLNFFIVGSLKPSMFSDLFEIPLEKFTDQYVTSSGKNVFCASKYMEVYDGKKKIVITYSNELAYKNRVRVEKALTNALNKLENIKNRIKKVQISRDDLLIKVERIVGKQYLKGLIDYEIGDQGDEFVFSENKEAYDKLSKKFGKNLLFTDDLSLKPVEIVGMYNSKNIVEEQIKNLKDTHIIRFTPMWCWTDKMIIVHAFTCVMALLFLRLLVKKVVDVGICLSQQEIIDNLRRIKLILLQMPKSDKIITKITRLNDDQRALAKLFKLKEFSKAHS